MISDPRGMGDRSEYSASTYILRQRPLEEALEAIAAAGFGSVEVWANRSHGDPRSGMEGGEIARLLAASGLKAGSFHAPFAPIEAEAFSREYFTRWNALLDGTLERCGSTGSGLLVVHPLDRKRLNPTAEELPLLHDFFGSLCGRAKAGGVQVLLENLTGGGRPGELPCNLADLATFFGDLPLGFCLDLGHAQVNGRDPIAEAVAVGPRLLSVHLHSNDGREDSHLTPDQGVLDWTRVRRVLRGGGYGGKFVLETAGGDDPASVLARILALFSE